MFSNEQKNMPVEDFSQAHQIDSKLYGIKSEKSQNFIQIDLCAMPVQIFAGVTAIIAICNKNFLSKKVNVSEKIHWNMLPLKIDNLLLYGNFIQKSSIFHSLKIQLFGNWMGQI